jgi:hypothetical protein
MIIDLNFQLCVRSLDKGQWIPLDQEIQLSAFENKIFEETSLGLNYWTLGKEDRFITLITRSIFDKKKFLPAYIRGIEELKNNVDYEIIEQKFKLICFNYTHSLLQQIKEAGYSEIIANYYSFKNY